MSHFFNPKRMFTGAYTPNWLLRRKEVTMSAKVLYGRLIQYCNPEGVAFPKIPELAEEVGLSERQVGRVLAELEANNLIRSRQRGFKQSNEYRFLWHEWISEAAELMTGQDVCSRVGVDVQSGKDTDVQSGTDVDVHSIGKGDSKRRLGKDFPPSGDELTDLSPPVVLGNGCPSPSLDDVLVRADQMMMPAADAELFWNHYQSNGWRIDGDLVFDWVPRLRTWQLRDERAEKQKQPKSGNSRRPSGTELGDAAAVALGVDRGR